VLWALVFTRRAMTGLELQQWTGYKDDNIKLAVRLLVDLGWVIARSSRGPWCLAEGRQLPLAESDLIGLGAPTAATADMVGENNLREEAVAAAESESDLIGLDEQAIKNAWRRNLKACLDVGIGPPKSTEISKCEGVTPDLIRAHVADLVEGEGIGLAIVRILSNELPRTWQEDIKCIERPVKRPRRRRRRVERDPGEWLQDRPIRKWEKGFEINDDDHQP
jgi:hypothetical protein